MKHLSGAARLLLSSTQAYFDAGVFPVLAQALIEFDLILIHRQSFQSMC